MVDRDAARAQQIAERHYSGTRKLRPTRADLTAAIAQALAEVRAETVSPAALMNLLKPYVGHRSHCTYGQTNPDGDFCSCGLRNMKDKVNALLAPPAPERRDEQP